MTPSEYWYRECTGKQRQRDSLLFAGIVILWLATICLLSSCAGTKAQREAERYYSRRPDLVTAGIALKAARLKQDSTRAATAAITPAIKEKEIKETENKTASALRRATSFLFGGKKTGKEIVQTSPNGLPKKCKGCQFVIQNGTGNTNTSTQANTEKKGNSAAGEGAKVTVAGKNSTQATDSATAAATGGGAAAIGPGASASGGAAPVEALSPLAVIANNFTSWIPYVAGGAALVLGFWLWRKKKQTNSLLS